MTEADRQITMDQMHTNFAETEAPLSEKDVERILARFSDPSLRAEAMAVLTIDGPELIERMTGDKNLAIKWCHLAAMSKCHADELRGLADMLDSVGARLSLALAKRSDASDIVKLLREKRVPN